jgi:hypothetical protein
MISNDDVARRLKLARDRDLTSPRRGAAHALAGGQRRALRNAARLATGAYALAGAGIAAVAILLLVAPPASAATAWSVWTVGAGAWAAGWLGSRLR